MFFCRKIPIINQILRRPYTRLRRNTKKIPTKKIGTVIPNTDLVLVFSWYTKFLVTDWHHCFRGSHLACCALLGQPLLYEPINSVCHWPHAALISHWVVAGWCRMSVFFSCLSRSAVVGECLLCRFSADVKLPVCVHALTGRDRGARQPATVPGRPGTAQAVREINCTAA